MNIIKHKYGKRTVSLLLAVILVLCPLQVRAADNKPTIEIGDYIQMGTYGGVPIVWRCVAKDSNGPLMLSDRVLCDYMPYDAKTNKNAETGSHRRNSWRDNFGSNHWRDSNIRSWLNSNAEAGKVKWLCGNPPTEDSVYPKTAAYDQKEGFLRSFRSDELGAIRTVKQRSIVSHPEYTAGYIDAAGVDLPYNTTIDTVADGYDSAHYEYIWDRVFLLDVQQLKTVNDNLNGYHIAKNRSGVAWNYWLRTPITTCNHDMRFVTPQGNILRDAPYKGYYGVRPAFYLNTENYTISSGTGQSAQDPYVVSAPDAPDDSIGISGAVREDVNGDWNVNTDEYLQLEMSTLYTEDPAYANVTVPVYTIQKPRSDKENMVIVYCAEGYTKSQQKQFVEDVKKLWGEVLQIEPYRSMADRFNVYALCTASVDGYGGTSTFFAATAKGGISTNKGNWRNHVLERIIGPAFIEKIHDAHIPNETHPNENTMDHNYRQYDYVYENINQFVVLANSGEYFGGSHDNKQYGIHYIVASARNAYSAFTQRHELGHGLFHLGDEYNYSTVPVDEANYTTSLNMTATKDPTKVKWKQLLGFRNTYTCPHYDSYPYTYNSSRDCLMRETFQNDFCDVCKLQGMKVMSQLIKNPPALYVAVPEVKKYIGDYRNPAEKPFAFEAANSSAYASYQYDRNSRLLSGGSKNNFDYSKMKGQQKEGITRAEVSKALALALADRKECEAEAKQREKSWFSEQEQDNWFVKYMDLLYERGYLNPELTPADLESAQKEFTYQEAAYTAAKFSGRLKRQVGLKDKNRQKPFPADQWWELYREILKEADPDENVKEITAILYGTPSNIQGAPSWTAYTTEGEYGFQGLALDAWLDHEIRFMVRGNEIAAVTAVKNGSVVYRNIWLSEVKDGVFKAYMGAASREFKAEGKLAEEAKKTEGHTNLHSFPSQQPKYLLRRGCYIFHCIFFFHCFF